MAQQNATGQTTTGTNSLADSRALQTVLEGLTRVYCGEQLDVTVDDSSQSKIDSDGNITIGVDHSHVGADLDRSEHFRIATNDVSHETEHYLETDLGGISEFADQYPACRNLAASVWNIVEDVYIDEQRFDRRPKLRAVAAWYGSLMADGDVWTPVDELVETADPVSAISSGIVQIKWIGTPKGYSALDPQDDEQATVRDVLADARDEIERAKSTHDQDDRTAIAHSIMDRILDEYSPDEWDNAESLLDDLMRTLMSADPGAPPIDDAEPRRSPDGDGTADGPDADRTDAEVSDDADADTDADTDADAGAGDTSEQASDTDADNAQADASGEPGDASGDSDEAGDEPDTADAMDRADASGDSDDAAKEWQDIDEDTDLDDAAADATDDKEERYERREERMQNPIRKRAADRDEVIERVADGHRYNIHSDADARELQRYARRGGLIDSIKREFQDLRSKPQGQASRSGARAHKSNIVRHAAGDKSIRKLSRRREPSTFGGRAVSFALDGSGSMDTDDTESGYSRLEEAKVALGALATAIDEMGDTVMGSCFDSRDDPRLVTAPDEDFSWQHLDGVDATLGATPMAEGVEDAAELLDGANAQQRALFVLCDGEPESRAATKRQIESARRDGIDVIGVGFGGAEEHDMRWLFGDDEYVVTSPDSLAEDVVGVYRDMI
jgi:hypothetical protein